MQGASSADKDYELWVLLHQTKDAVYKARDKELMELGISPIMAAVLVIVEAIDGPATPAEISRWLFRESHTVSGLLQRMEDGEGRAGEKNEGLGEEESGKSDSNGKGPAGPEYLNEKRGPSPDILFSL